MVEAIRALEAVGYLARAIPPAGSHYKATAEGLRRRSILYVFGSGLRPRVHRRRQTGWGDPWRPFGARRPNPHPPALQGRLRAPRDQLTNPTKSKSVADPLVLMGQLRKVHPQHRSKG